MVGLNTFGNEDLHFYIYLKFMSLTLILNGQFVLAGGGYSLRINHNHDVAENTAIMYSLLGCCAETDVNPREVADRGDNKNTLL